MSNKLLTPTDTQSFNLSNFDSKRKISLRKIIEDSFKLSGKPILP